MRTAVIEGPLEMSLQDQEVPEPGSGEVRLRVRAAGLCAGDLGIYRGKNPYVRYPCVGGHEVAAEVEGTGELVVVEPFLPCGRCYACRVGKPNCCANLVILGVHRPGGFADWMVAPADRVHRVPEGLDPLWASFAEPLAIAVHAARRAELGEERCLVLGCGPIGLALVEVARARGATVLATDVDAARLEMARSLGAETRLSDEGLLDWTLGRTDGEGLPVVFEATGVPAVIASALDLVAPGGRVVIVGLVPRGTKVPFEGLDLTRKEATLLGSRTSADCFPEALSLLASGQITYPRVATELPLEAAPETFARLAQDPGALHKAVFVL